MARVYMIYVLLFLWLCGWYKQYNREGYGV